jgi:hypothetical protein
MTTVGQAIEQLNTRIREIETAIHAADYRDAWDEGLRLRAVLNTEYAALARVWDLADECPLSQPR